MTAIVNFVFILLDYALTAVVWLVIANVIASWLVAFDVINLRNRAAYNLVRALDQVTAPILAPVRRILPSLGSVDISPLVLVVVISAAQRTIIPAAHDGLISLIRGY